MKERLKKTPFYKFKERKLLKKQIDSMTNIEPDSLTPGSVSTKPRLLRVGWGEEGVSMQSNAG